MNKPYIICHMMTSLDGRIDCTMTSKLVGVDEYYETLSAIDCPSTLSGRVTAQMEMSRGNFLPKNTEPFGKETFSKKKESNAYEVIVDSKGSLLWDDQKKNEKPLLIITSKKVTKEYLSYLDSLNISYIVCGDEHIDLKKAMEVLANDFNVKRLAIVGGGTINAAFLNEGLLDEISILLSPGVDGRKGEPSVFDGLSKEKEPYLLKLKDIKKYDNGAVWLRYLVG